MGQKSFPVQFDFSRSDEGEKDCPKCFGLGDIMVDRYVYRRAGRISAEAPIPIMLHQSERVMLGAVGNVARNVASLGGHARIVALVGAGCSTESGIPDYRGPQGSLRKRKPMQYQEFVSSPEGRARYWSRSAVGWPVFAKARPNAAHRALAANGFGDF